MSAASGPQLGPVGWVRWVWRQLTSMRTALVLLLLLAVAALPGSYFPQRGISPDDVAAYLQTHGTTGRWLDRLGFFDVYSSVWFSSIYLLLVISLVGCIVPRTWTHLRGLTKPPPRAPRNLKRLPAYAQGSVETPVAQALAAADAEMRSRRMRLRTVEPGDTALAGQVGLLKESGNILFHIALLGVILASALGHLLGWRGDVIVPVGETFTNTSVAYNTIAPGPWVDVRELKPATLAVTSMDVRFESDPTSPQRGAPRHFSAQVDISDPLGTPSRTETLAVNDPVTLGGASVFLLGNGYAPVITVRNADGDVLYSQATPFLPQDPNYRSVGAVKVPAASPQQLGLVGFLLPTLRFDAELGPVSDFPQPIRPALVMAVYEGDLFAGGPQSVFSLDTDRLTQVEDQGEPTRLVLSLGQTITLPDGRGTVTFERLDRWAGLSVRHDPGKGVALGSAVLMIAGLLAMLMGRRHRLFVRVTEVDERHTLVEVGALARSEDPRLADLVTDVRNAIEERCR